MDQVVAARTVAQSTAAIGRAPSLPRRDLYGPVHKEMRLRLTDILVRLGATDFADAASVRRVVSELIDVLDVCTSHLRLENDLLHEAVERRRPGVMARLEGAHAAHEDAIAELYAYAARAEHADRDAGAEGRRLYLRYAAFVGENLVHMTEEEELAQAMLEEIYSVEELQKIHVALLADPAWQELAARSVPPRAATPAV
jgi:hypothetical protein